MVSFRMSPRVKKLLLEAMEMASEEMGTSVTQTQLVEMAICEYHRRRQKT